MMAERAGGWNNFLNSAVIYASMYRSIVILLFCLITSICTAQRAQQVMLAIQSDLIKSDNDGFFEKMQGGFEGSYYTSRKFAVTAGIEWWSDRKFLLIPGIRFCPIDEAFLRLRGLIGDDLSIGGGFAKPLSDRLRIEATGDLYFEGHIAIRAGLAYGFGKRP